MDRKAKDIWGDLWRIAEARQTRHGFDVLLGRPDTVRRRGGAVIVCTQVLVDHLTLHTLTPASTDLPIGTTALKRLRRLLDLGWWEARAAWCAERSNDLRDLTIAEFVARHGGSTGAAANARLRMRGRTLREAHWHLSESNLAILLSDHPTALIADAWDAPASTVRRLRMEARNATR